ncbi:hypothetical protein BBK82_43295 [Lentzea guizhouensis]|uniref:Secreted protein n=1 Tax=Lentzea guizhouensis TaxID=1586287 RepID=A0A1B2HVK8_9PSEU|nr:DUF6493 family protein [Lentzea guizhouensis]ANZ41761.1 hypothetical protein BBK82_43295 [Lentzea guizhouensis]
MTFGRIRSLIESDQVLALGEALKLLTPQQCKETAPELVAYEKVHRSESRWTHRETLAVAGAGLLPNASTLTPWLVRYHIWHHRTSPHDGTAVVLDVLRHRQLTWLPDLVARLARMPTRELTRRDLLRVILEFCGDTPPDTDGFLLHFLDFGGHTRWRPEFDALVPRMLEVVGAGVIFANVRQWRLFLRDRAPRPVLLDGVLARLQQGGSAREMEGFLALHEVLQVTPDEVAEHARDYVAMLPDSRSTVATLAQQQLKSLDEAGKLDFDLLCEASRWVFARSEKKLVRTQLTWLGKHGNRPDEVALTTAELFAHESDDLRGQAVKLVGKLLAKVSPATRAEIVTLAEQLPPDLAARLGGVTVAEDVVELAAFAPRPFPEPIATLDELTRELLGLFGRNAGPVEAVVAERIVEAVVRFGWQDRIALGRAMQPVYAKQPWLAQRSMPIYHRDYVKREPRTELMEIISVVGDLPRPVGPLGLAVAFAREWRTQLKRSRAGRISEQLALRLHEIAEGLQHAPRPALVSTPTWMSGLLDADTLLERLAKAEAEGWEPWQRDLKQAFHRLPRDVRPDAFASLSGRPGQQLRRWLEVRVDPSVVAVERTYTVGRYSSHEGECSALLATVEPGLPAPEDLYRGYDEWGPMIECWPAALPAHRDVVAAWLVPHLRHRLDSKGDDGPLLPLLAEADGPVGPGLTLALAYGLGAELTVNRAYAVDALLVLASRSQLDGAALGTLLGRCSTAATPCWAAWSRRCATPPLRAARPVWDVVVAALPQLWTHNRVADLVELAVELAQQLTPGGTVPGLAEVAARKGTSKAVVQAKRLAAVLQ